jgi:hypothetical protein
MWGMAGSTTEPPLFTRTPSLRQAYWKIQVRLAPDQRAGGEYKGTSTDLVALGADSLSAFFLLSDRSRKVPPYARSSAIPPNASLSSVRKFQICLVRFQWTVLPAPWQLESPTLDEFFGVLLAYFCWVFQDSARPDRIKTGKEPWTLFTPATLTVRYTVTLAGQDSNLIDRQAPDHEATNLRHCRQYKAFLRQSQKSIALKTLYRKVDGCARLPSEVRRVQDMVEVRMGQQNEIGPPYVRVHSRGA